MANFIFVKTWNAGMGGKEEINRLINLNQIYMIDKVNTDQYQLFLSGGYSTFINEVECKKILKAVGYGEDKIDLFNNRMSH